MSSTLSENDHPQGSISSRATKYAKLMRQDDIAATLAADPRVIVPVGTCVQIHPTLPVGCMTLVAERLADDLSAEFGVLRAPTVEYGVNADRSPHTGHVTLRKKTLHRQLNDMVASWETHNVAECIFLTAHGYDPHQEALGTVSAALARVRVVDIFAVHYADLLPDTVLASDRTVPMLALCAALFPDLITKPPSLDASLSDSALGMRLYDRLRSRIAERIFDRPPPDVEPEPNPFFSHEG